MCMVECWWSNLSWAHRKSETEWFNWHVEVCSVVLNESGDGDLWLLQLTNVIHSNLNSSTAARPQNICTTDSSTHPTTHATEFTLHRRIERCTQRLQMPTWNSGMAYMLTIQHLDHTRLASNPFNYYYWNTRRRCADFRPWGRRE